MTTAQHHQTSTHLTGPSRDGSLGAPPVEHADPGMLLGRDASPYQRGAIPLLPVLLPDTAALVTVRHLATWPVWRTLLAIGRETGCAHCGGRSASGRVALVESWRFADGRQSFVGLVAVCPACHAAVAWDVTRNRDDQMQNAVAAHVARLHGWIDDRWSALVATARQERRRLEGVRWVAQEEEVRERLLEASEHLLLHVRRPGVQPSSAAVFQSVSAHPAPAPVDPVHASAPVAAPPGVSSATSGPQPLMRRVLSFLGGSRG